MPVPNEFRFTNPKATVKPLQLVGSSPIPIASPAPRGQSIPMPQPVQEKTSGLQKVFNALSVPAKFTEKVLTGGQGYESTFANPNSFLTKAVNFANLPITISRKLTGQKPILGGGDVNDPAVKAIAGGSRFTNDPLNVVPFGKGGELLSKAGKFVSKATGIGKTIEKVTNFAKTTPKIYKAIETVNPYFRNPEFGKVVQEAERATGTRINRLYRELKDMTSKISPEDQVHIGEVIENIAQPKNAKVAQIASRVKTITEQIGKEAVDAGLLTKESFKKYTKAGYMSHIENLIPDAEKSVSSVKEVARIVGNQFKKRTGKLTEYTKEFAPVVYKGLGSEIKDIESAKLYQTISKMFGKKIGKGAEALPGFVRASEMGIEGRGYAKAFRNIQIPNAVAEYLTKVREVAKPNVYDKAMNVWKAGKTIWNPAYHVRNNISNPILSSMGTGKNLISTVSNYIKAVKEYRQGTSSLFKVAQDIGLVGRKNFSTGLNELLDTAGLTSQNWLQKLAEKPKLFQNFSEETSKLNVFKTWMERLGKQNGLGLEDALKNKDLVKQAFDKAEEAIFSPYRISAGERSTIGRVIPFYSFTRQALPFTVKTLVDNPKSLAVFGKIKSAIESLSEDPNVELPDYMKDQIRIGNKDGKVTYFDPKYIYPFGNFVENGLGKGQLPFGLSFPPFATEIAAQLMNKDPYFQQEIYKSNIPIKAVGEGFAHFYRTASPQAIVSMTNTLWPALTGKKDAQGRTRNIWQAVLSTLGLKTSSTTINDLETKNLRSEKAKQSSIQQEIDQILSDPNATRSEKERDIQKLRSLQ